MYAYTATPTAADLALATELARVNTAIADGSDPITLAEAAGYAAYLADAPTNAPMHSITVHALLAPLGPGKAARNAAVRIMRAYGRGWDQAATDTWEDHLTAIALDAPADAAAFAARHATQATRACHA